MVAWHVQFLTAGIYSKYTAAEFAFLCGITLNSVTVDPSSSPLFEPGSVLGWSGDHIGLVLSNTCPDCVGITDGGPGSAAALAMMVWVRRHASRATDRQP